MPSASLLPPDIADHLGRGGAVVTGNQRAARSLRLAFDRNCRANGLASWRPPTIFAWDTWTAGLYRQALLEGSATRILLNRTQELQVWCSVVEADSQWTSLQTVGSLAAMAADAWQLLCAYRGQQRLKHLGVSGDTRAFQCWAEAFTRRCKTDEYLSAAELDEALVTVGTLTLSIAGVRLLGFDSRTPAQQAVIDALRDRGMLVEDQPPAVAAAVLYRSTAATEEAELSQTALWIRGHLRSSPDAAIAVIVPNLAAERYEIDRVFRHVLAPELEDITVTDTANPYEFSLGQPLAETPLVAVALILLRFVTGALPITSISRLLLSPYFISGQEELSAGAELSARAEFDAFELRNTPFLRPEATLGRFRLLAERSKHPARLSNLLRQLRSLERTAATLLADPAPRQRAWSDWAETIREVVQSSGWPGTKPLDSTEFQARQKFDSALDELATLDFEGSRPTFTEVLEQLESLLQRTLFAPESREAPVQIMSPLEAAGSRFDALCFLRASDLDWPARPPLNPLLGWRLQRELGMPGSDAALDFAHAQRIIDRIAASAETVVFSYATQTVDGHQRPSPMLAGLGLGPLAQLDMAPAIAAVELETVEDDAFIPLTNFTVRGGANVLKLQAACGFRAFAEGRLWSTPIGTLEPGMDAPERGSIVHSALDHLWSDLRTQSALRALTPEQRAAQLTRSIEHGLRRAAASLAADAAASSWDNAYLDLQRQRLHRLLAPWLELELGRPPFEVAVREESDAVAIGPLSLKIRVDRVDRLLDEEGGNVLIDYKTGLAKPSAWATERPDEPQLPLYAVLREPDSLAAVAFANIRAGDELALQGFASREGVLQKTARPQFDSLEEQLKDWHRVLTALAEGFAAGDVRVRPKAYPATCAQCHQRLLCRLDPALLTTDDNDGEDAPEEADA
jgi:ATP-dependent helicase/nuclease subunit B